MWVCSFLWTLAENLAGFLFLLLFLLSRALRPQDRSHSTWGAASAQSVFAEGPLSGRISAPGAPAVCCFVSELCAVHCI